MDVVESMKSTARDVVTAAARQGLNLSHFCCAGTTFYNGRRHIFMWREKDEIRYNLQGRVLVLPAAFKESLSAFRGHWHETGSFRGITEAVEFVQAWVVDEREVDDLPPRQVRSRGIG